MVLKLGQSNHTLDSWQLAMNREKEYLCLSCVKVQNKLPMMFVVNLKFQTNVKDETEQQR